MGGAYLLRTRHKVQALLGMGIVAALVLFVLPDAFWTRMQTIQTYEEDNDGSALGRLHFWAVAGEMAKTNPFLGVGYMGYNLSYDNYDFSHGMYGSGRAVHSSFFGVLAELGYLGIILYGVIFVCSFSNCLRVRRCLSANPQLSEKDKYATALEASLVVFVVGGTFLPMQYNEMLWHYIGLTIALENIVTRHYAEVTTHRVVPHLQKMEAAE
jgi:O-antigen ligase